MSEPIRDAADALTLEDYESVPYLLVVESVVGDINDGFDVTSRQRDWQHGPREHGDQPGAGGPGCNSNQNLAP